MLNLIRQNRLADAIEEGRLRLNDNPNDLDALYALGIVYLMLGNLGVAYLRNKEFDKAIDLFERRPENPI